MQQAQLLLPQLWTHRPSLGMEKALCLSLNSPMTGPQVCPASIGIALLSKQGTWKYVCYPYGIWKKLFSPQLCCSLQNVSLAEGTVLLYATRDLSSMNVEASDL